MQTDDRLKIIEGRKSRAKSGDFGADVPIIKGWVKKRSPKKVMFAHVWQKRYMLILKLSARAIYFKTEKAAAQWMEDQVHTELGAIPLDRLEKFERAEGSKEFVLVLEGGRKFHFWCDNLEKCDEWESVIRGCKKGNLRRLATDEKAEKFWKPKKQDADLFHFFEGSAFPLCMQAPEARAFASFFTLETFERNTVLFQQAETKIQKKDGLFFLLLSGKVTLTIQETSRDNSMPVTRLLCDKAEGDYFGGSSIYENRRLTTALCRTNVTVLMLTKEGLQDYLKRYPQCQEIVFNLMGINPWHFLRKIDMFAKVEDSKLCLVGELFKTLVLLKDELLFEEGSDGENLYIVDKGICTAIGTCDGKQEVLFEFEPGDVFGEISLIMQIPRTATVIAKDFCTLLELRKEAFTNLLEMIPREEMANLKRTMKRQTAAHFRKYKVPFFEAIPEDKYFILADLCHIKPYPPNHTLFTEGERGDCFYIIVDGKAKITVKESDGTTKMLAQVNAGDYFGEIALVQDTPRTATVTTVERCVILTISKAQFKQFFRAAPEAIADFEIKLARYDVELRSVIYHTMGYKYFKQFLQSEYSEENIDFWTACRDFRHLAHNDYDSSDSEAVFTMDNISKYRHTVSGSIAQQIWTLLVLQCLEARSAYDKVESEEDHPLSAIVKKLENDTPDISFSEFTEALLVLFRISLNPEEIHQLYLSLGGKDINSGDASKYAELTVSFEGFLQNKEDNCKVGQFVHEVISCEMARLMAIFDALDVDKSGEIDQQEFFAACKRLDFKLDRQATRQKFCQILKVTGKQVTSDAEISRHDFILFNLLEKIMKFKHSLKIKARAMVIYDNWVKKSAPYQVNLKGVVLKGVEDAIAANNFHVKMFHDAEEEIIHLMNADSFGRFKQSKLFAEFLEKMHSYNVGDLQSKIERSQNLEAEEHLLESIISLTELERPIAIIIREYALDEDIVSAVQKRKNAKLRSGSTFVPSQGAGTLMQGLVKEGLSDKKNTPLSILEEEE
mmetsp:Transcript_8514/g.16278  ORF Transcript_8514/g.16278 Transcript_8514/m.16278 type:complete len:1011 (-) Transcript_8514:52-3084(-)